MGLDFFPEVYICFDPVIGAVAADLELLDLMATHLSSLGSHSW